MFLTFLLTLAGCMLVARVAAADEKAPQDLIVAIAMLGTSLVLHLTGDAGIVETVGALSIQFGIGLVVAAGFIARRRGPARPFFAIGILALSIGVLIAGGRRLLGPSGETASLLLELGPDDSIEELDYAASRFGASFERAFPRVTLGEDEDLSQVYIVTVPSDVVDAFSEAVRQDRENVDHLETNRLLGVGPPLEATPVSDVQGDVLEDDPLVPRQWALDAIRGHEAHRLLVDLEPERRARVAIIDTGVDGSHEDISNAVSRSPALRDQHGHGSHCAGIAAGVTNNGLGIASLNWEGRFVEVTSYAALDANGFGTIEQIAQAVLDASRDGADVLSMSLGDRSPVPPKVLSDAIGYARRQGAVVVAAAGNSNADAAEHTPSNVQGVISVAALDASLRKARFSNVNNRLERPISAPGVDILSLRTGGGYVPMSGTSMATPMVAGLVGIMRSLNPDLEEAEIFDILSKTGRTVPEAARTGPMIDAEAAIRGVLDAR